jgi:Ran GTPase-activating protein (RanGAP) involved in mRNA processing and transport
MLLLADDSLVSTVEFPDAWCETKIERVFTERVRGNAALQSLSICNKAYRTLAEKELMPDLLQSVAITSSCLTNLELRGEPYEEEDPQIHGGRASLGCIQDLRAFLTAGSSLLTLKIEGCSLGSRVIRPVCGLPSGEAEAGGAHVDVDHIQDKGMQLISETLRQHSWLRCLHMPGNRMTLVEAGAFPCALKQHLALQVLDLSSNNIGTIGAQKLADALKETASLQSLVLRANFINSIGASNIGDSLKINTTLTLLNLADNCIDEKGITALADALKQNATLHALDVSLNRVHATGATALAEALAWNTSLRDLNLENTRIGTDSGAAEAAIGKLVEKNCGLRRLRLGHNGISEGNGIPVGKALGTNTTLQVLDLSRNQLTVSDARAIAAGLKRNTTLESLTVDPFGLHKEDMEPIADAITQTSSLRDLRWTQYRVQDDSVKLLAKAAGSNLSLQYLDLSALTLCKEGMWEMCSALASHPALLVLKLSVSPRPECIDCHDAMFHLLFNNKKLQHLDVDARDTMTADCVLLALVNNSTLQSLRLECSRINSIDTVVALRAITMASSSLTNIDVAFHQADALDPQDLYTMLCLRSLAASMSTYPRFGAFRLKGIPFTWVKNRLELPAKNADGEEWTDDCIPAHIHMSASDRLAAFVMGLHPRAGQESFIRNLSDDSVQLIVLSFFRLPWKCFEKREEPEYVSLLRRFSV